METELCKSFTSDHLIEYYFQIGNKRIITPNQLVWRDHRLLSLYEQHSIQCAINFSAIHPSHLLPRLSMQSSIYVPYKQCIKISLHNKWGVGGQLQTARHCLSVPQRMLY